VKIAPIYEGTNGIQALTLVGRQMGMRKGKNLMNLFGMVMKNIAAQKANQELAKYAAIMEEAANAVADLGMFFAGAVKSGGFILPILNACKFLEIIGDVLVGHFLIEAAGISTGKLAAIYVAKGADSIGKQKALQREDKEAAFYAGKIAAAKFFITDVIPAVKARCESIKLGDKSAMEVVEDSF